jgi:type III secretion protein W
VRKLAFDVNMTVGGSMSPLGEQQAQAAKAQGTLGGFALTVSSEADKLADAAEELTFGVDNTDELELKERKEKDSLSPFILERVLLYQELMHQAGNEDKQAEFVKALRSAKNAQDALERTRQFYPDSTDAYAALSEAADSLEPGNPLESVLREALSELESSDGERIRAGLAAALAGREYSELGSALELKGDYQKVVFDFADGLEMLNHIMEKFGADGFEKGLDFLFKALAQDLAAETPSREKASLETTSRELGQAKTLNGVHALGQKLVERWRTAHQQSSDLSAMDYLKFVAGLKKEPYLSASVADPLVAKAGPCDPEKEVLFRQDLLNTTKTVTMQAFEDLESRQRCLAALQEGLDQAIDREDVWLAAMEENS